MDNGCATAGQGQSAVVNEKDINISVRSLGDKKHIGNKNQRGAASLTTAGSKKVIEINVEDVQNATFDNDDSQVRYNTDIFQ